MNTRTSTKPSFSWLGGLFLLAAVIALGACAPSNASRSTLAQVSTFNALQMGLFDGDVPYARLKQLGDFGIGTFDGLDGEMVALDGVFYQVKADGKVSPATDDMEAPFADVHFFEAERSVTLKNPAKNYAELQAQLDQFLTKPNNLYAIKVKAVFPYIKVRSVPRQNEPFPTLADAIQQQTEFEHENMPGTLGGYWMPKYLVNVGVPGYHLHFISDDKQHGGHVLDCRVDKAEISMDALEHFTLVIPQGDTFHQMDVSATQTQ